MLSLHKLREQHLGWIRPRFVAFIKRTGKNHTSAYVREFYFSGHDPQQQKTGFLHSGNIGIWRFVGQMSWMASTSASCREQANTFDMDFFLTGLDFALILHLHGGDELSILIVISSIQMGLVYLVKEVVVHKCYKGKREYNTMQVYDVCEAALVHIVLSLSWSGLMQQMNCWYLFDGV